MGKLHTPAPGGEAGAAGEACRRISTGRATIGRRCSPADSSCWPRKPRPRSQPCFINRAISQPWPPGQSWRRSRAAIAPPLLRPLPHPARLARWPAVRRSSSRRNPRPWRSIWRARSRTRTSARTSKPSSTALPSASTSCISNASSPPTVPWRATRSRARRACRPPRSTVRPERRSRSRCTSPCPSTGAPGPAMRTCWSPPPSATTTSRLPSTHGDTASCSTPPGRPLHP